MVTVGCYIRYMAYAKRMIEPRGGDREPLEQWLRSRTAPLRQVEWASIVLGAAGGLSGHALNERLGLSRPTIRRWLDRYEADGIAGLEDLPGAGGARSRSDFGAGSCACRRN